MINALIAVSNIIIDRIIAIKEIKWASVNNSVFLCSQCAEFHQSLGENISKIYSLDGDLLNDDELTILRIGGNKRLASLLSEYNIPNKIQKYNTRIAHYYRRLLLIEGSFMEENDPNQQYQELITIKPTIEEGNKLIDTNDSISDCIKEKQINDGNPPAYTVHEGVKEDFNQITKAVGGLFGWLGVAFKTTTEVIGIDKKINETRNEINESLSQIKINDNVKYAGNKVYEAMKTSSLFVSNKLSESKTLQSVTHSVDQSYITLKQTFNDIIKPITYIEKEESKASNDPDPNTYNTYTNVIINQPDPNNNNNIIMSSIDNNAPPILEDEDNINFYDINNLNHK